MTLSAVRSLERISALSDALFAIAMTLIVLEIHASATSVERSGASPGIVAQALYAVGASLCLISTYWSIAFIVVVQLNFAVAPRIPILSRV